MNAEAMSLVLGLEYFYLVRSVVEELLNTTLYLEAMIDSQRVFNMIDKDAKVQENRLQIDVLALCQIKTRMRYRG